MSKDGQLSTALLIEKGGAINAFDTYGYTPLHRMASNNLALGAEELCKAGADFNKRTSRGETPMSVARSSGAGDVMNVIEKYVKAAKTAK
jgi:ankyrin repeat protein